MPRTKKNFDKISTRLAFLSLKDSEVSRRDANIILWTLRAAGVNEEVISNVVAQAESLAAAGDDDFASEAE